MVVYRLYGVMANWVLVALPMFIFMGIMMDKSGIAEDLMTDLSKLFGKTRGGLAISIVFIGVLLAASTGIIGAAVVLLTILGVPLMLKNNYNPNLACGVVCATGTLGILIPPSIMLVIMGDQVRISVGDLFMGAVFPGLMLGLLYTIFIISYAYVNPKAAPLPKRCRTCRFQNSFKSFKIYYTTSFINFCCFRKYIYGDCNPNRGFRSWSFRRIYISNN
jgi:tripartite ATP-independent transporter DctM subunit